MASAESLRQGFYARFATGFAAGAALLGASLVNFLSYNDYPFFRPEVGLVMLGLFGVAAAIAFLHGRLPLRFQPLVEGLLAAWFIDFNFESIPLMIGAGLAVAAVGWWRRVSLMGPMAVLGSVVLITTAVGLGGRPPWIRTVQGPKAMPPSPISNPAVLHLLLDEQAGIEGLAQTGRRGAVIAAETRDAYLQSGFTVYGGAYSRYFDTVNAVPDILNYGRRLGRAIRKGGVEVGPTVHLEALLHRGYRLTIFQSDYADYCRGAQFQTCITYDSSSLRPTLDAPMIPMDRAQLIALKFLSLSDLFKLAAKGWNAAARILPLRPYDSDAKNSSTVASFAILGPLTELVAKARPGDAIFAHVLLPHYPYALRRDCSYRPWPEWQNRHSQTPIEERQRLYGEQVRCTTTQVAGLTRKFLAAAGPDAIVIVHGDHGSRITRIDPYDQARGKLSAADLEAGFSTLFAVRAPGVTAGYIPNRAATPHLLRDFTANGFKTVPTPNPEDPATITIVARKTKARAGTVPMPTAAVGPPPIHR